MRKGQRKTVRKRPVSMIEELDAAIALLTRARALAASNGTSNGTSPKVAKPVSRAKGGKRTLSTEAREAIAAAQRKRWARVRRAKKQAQRTALTK
jgi:hypothetical protein